MTKVKHPTNRMERRRSAEAKALRLFKPKRIDGTKRKALVELEDKETQDELRESLFDRLPDQSG